MRTFSTLALLLVALQVSCDTQPSPSPLDLVRVDRADASPRVDRSDGRHADGNPDIVPDLALASCPASIAAGAACSLPEALRCPRSKCSALSPYPWCCDSLEECRCEGGKFVCAPTQASWGLACSFVDGLRCDYPPPPGPLSCESPYAYPALNCTCQSGKWTCFSKCHPSCPKSWSPGMNGQPCSFKSPEEGWCTYHAAGSASSAQCDCIAGKYSCQATP